MPAEFEEALRYNPDDARIFYNRSVARLQEARQQKVRRLKKKHLDDALTDATKAFNLNPSQVVRDTRNVQSDYYSYVHVQSDYSSFIAMTGCIQCRRLPH